MDYKIFWTEEATNNLENIFEYLRFKWTEKEVDNFKTKLSRQIELISSNPAMLPVSVHVPRLRKAVLSKQTTIFYEVKDNHIYLAYIWVNKKDFSKLR